MLSELGFSKGFTLIELMIGLALLALLLMLGVPAFSVVIENSRIKSAASAFALGLQSARAHAISQNETVSFTPAAGGWSITDSRGVIEGKTAAESSGNMVAVTITPNAVVNVSFNGLGRPGSAADFDFASPSNSCELDGGNTRCLRVRLSAGGQVRVCDPKARAGDTRAC